MTNRIGIKKIVDSNKFVVVDGSALNLQEIVDPKVQEEFHQELNKNLGRLGVYTEQEVLEEVRYYRAPDNVKRLPLRKNLRGRGRRLANRAFSSLVAWLTPVARDRGIIDMRKKFPLADVKLAALALSLAQESVQVGFVSADRKLNDLVYDIYQQTRGVYPRGFPSLIGGEVNVYTLISSQGFFIPHQDVFRRFERRPIQQKLLAYQI